MTEKTTASRETLARVAGLVRPALATRDYVPALTHISFKDGRATAYNDVAAIGVRCTVNLGRCVPGELLIKALGSFGGSEVLVQDGKNGDLSLKSGRGAAMRLPTLPADAHPFKWPSAGEGAEMPLPPALVRAVERCLLSVGSDSNHPATMGVTLESEDDKAVLYSTDNYTISRCETDAKCKLPGDAPVILPRFFCEQLVLLSKAFPDEKLMLVLLDGALLVEFGDEASLLTRTPLDLVPMDFPRIVRKHCDLTGLRDTLVVIPDEFDAALSRALLVLGGEVSKETEITLADGELSMVSETSLGEAEDAMPFPWSKDLRPFTVDPALVARGAKACSLVGFTDKVTVMADADCRFVHIVAHATPLKQKRG